MSEVLDAPVQVSTEKPNTEISNVTTSPFAKDAWNENQPEIKEPENKPEVIDKPEAELNKPEIQSPVLDPNAYLKTKWGWENEEIADQEIKTLREKAAKEPEVITFADDESKQIYELLREGGEKKKEVTRILKEQEQIDDLVSISEINKDNAEDILKLQMKLKNKEKLTSKEIDFQYKENFAIPKEPVQKATEDDDDFKDRMDDWKENVERIETKRVIAAKLAQSELSALKKELVFPEINKPNGQVANEPNPELLKEIRDAFLNKLESDYTKAEGFTTKVKDESVEIPVSFKIPDEDKIAIKKQLENDFDFDGYINTRWFGEKGEPKIEQIISDLFLLNNTDKVLSGIANKSANERILEFRKQANNIDLKTQTNQNTFQPNADGKQNVSPFKKGAWSENPNVLT